ncbi:MAG TPA: type II secretion system F family protein [Chloroflexota bacterium]|nr:type II secretion system F family protein [Chloroflexota bacterium]
MNALLPPVVFVVVTIMSMTAFSFLVADQSVIEQRLSDYRRSSGSPLPAALPTGSILRQHQFSGIPAVQRFLAQRASTEKIASELAAARVSLRVGEYVLLRWFAALTIIVIVHLFGIPLVFATPTGFLGFKLPQMYVRRRQRQRVVKFNDQLVDSLTMMANALKAGSSFLQAIDLVSRELPAPISEEFAQVVTEVSVGSPVDTALEGLTRRIDSYDLYLVVTAMLIQRQTGGSLAEILDKIAQTIRERVRLIRQVQVLTGEQRLSAIIIGLLPIGILVFLIVTMPNYVEPLTSETEGRLMLGAAGVLEVIGFIVMNRLANIDI